MRGFYKLIKPYNDKWSNIVEELNSSKSRGLSGETIEKNRKKYGSNKILIKNNKLEILKEIFNYKNLSEFLNLILVGCCLYNNWILEGIIILVITIINCYIKFFIIYKDKERSKYIEKLNKVTVKVLRNGREEVISSSELVVGDIVLFSKNSLIAGDLRIIECENLKVDESNVTGEEFLKEKFDYKIQTNPSNIGEISNMIFRGAVIKEGNGSGIVIQTGNKSYLGNLLKSLERNELRKENIINELEKKISNRYMIVLGIISVIYLINRDLNILKFNILSLGSIVFILILMLHLKKIKDEFKRDDIYINNINVIKNIKKVTVVFLDKIGGISKEEIILKKILVDLKIINKDFLEYNNQNSKKIIEAIILANEGKVENEKIKGNLIEKAYLGYFLNKKILIQEIKNKNLEIFKIGMESDKRFTTSINKRKNGYRANCRGNFEDLIKRCKYINLNGQIRELDNGLVERLRGNNYNFLTQGLITEGIAYRNFDYKPREKENIESNLIFLGIIALENKIYEDSKERIDKIKKKGIVPILFTEDHKIAATFQGIKTGIIRDKTEAISGIEIEGITDTELIKLLAKIRIFSQVNLKLKNRIIDIFKNEGYKFLLVGEGIGELNSLASACVSVGKGEKNKIIKEVSDIYIKENYLQKLFVFYERSEILYREILKGLDMIFLGVINGIIVINGLAMIFVKELSNINYIIYILLINIYNFMYIYKQKDIFYKKKRIIIINILISIVSFCI